MRARASSRWSRKSVLFIAAAILALLAAGAAPSAQSATPGPIATIYRDGYGVPHIYADTLRGLFLGFGYAEAEDRLFQLEVLRRATQGTVAEVFGARFLPLDRATRLRAIPADELGQELAALDARHRTILNAFAEGISRRIEYLRAHPGEMPGEFAEFRMPLRPWSAEDVATIFIGTMAQVFSSGTNKLSNAGLLAAFRTRFGKERGEALFDEIVWLNDPRAPTTCPEPAGTTYPAFSGSRAQGTVSGEASVPRGIGDVAAGVEARGQEANALALELGLPWAAGGWSHAWLLSPQLSRSGYALLFGAPQFTWTVPGFLYEVGLHGAGFNVVGTTIVGHTQILFGHNSQIAWTSTAGVGTLTDVFVERLSPIDPRAYQFGGGQLAMTARTERYNVAGQQPVEETILSTVHGPVIATDPANQVAYTIKSSWRGAVLKSWASWLDSTQCGTLACWFGRAAGFALTIDWLYIDRQGTIAYAHTGWYPVRAAGVDPRLPLPGTGEAEWAGFVPFANQPHCSNPKQGFLVGWNNKPAPNWSNPDYASWSHADRQRVIVDTLDAMVRQRGRLSVEDIPVALRRVAFADVNAAVLKPPLLQSLAGTTLSPAADQARRLLDAWDGQRVDRMSRGTYDSPAVTIFQAWVETMLRMTFEPVLGPSAGPLLYAYPSPAWGFSLNTPLGVRVLEHLLSGPAAGVPSSGLFPPATVQATAARALERAIQDLARAFGTEDMRLWRAPTLEIRWDQGNGFVGRVPQTSAALPAIPYMNRGTQEHLVEAGPVMRGWNVNPPGESGIQGNLGTHYADQIALYRNFRFKPMLFSFEDVQRAAVKVTRLE